MPTGRPSKLTAKIIEQAKEYVEGGWAREKAIDQMKNRKNPVREDIERMR